MWREEEGYAFDMDGTITEPAQVMDVEMAGVLLRLVEKSLVAIISGGTLEQVLRQCGPFFDKANLAALVDRIMIFPTGGARGYVFDRDFWNNWKKVYEYGFGSGEALRVLGALSDAMHEVGYFERREVFLAKLGYSDLPASWGQIVSDRGSLITFAALGENSPLEARKAWDPSRHERLKIMDLINRRVGNIAVARVGGASSVDITLLGVDKGLAVRKWRKMTELDFYRIRFTGDAFYLGGNDYPVRATGVQCYPVSSLEETRALIRSWL